MLGGEPAGHRPDLLDRFGAFVELHVEQGRALDAPVGVATAIWPHGRWRMDFAGDGQPRRHHAHGGPPRPMLTYAFAVLAANKEARLRGAHATVGRVSVAPNATNAVPSRVTGWLDARAADARDAGRARRRHRAQGDRPRRPGRHDGRRSPRSPSPPRCPSTRRSRPASPPSSATRPLLPTGAGHDAGVLSAHLPTAMLFVRNPTGVSHAPDEHATDDDCAAGVAALAAVLAELAA